MGLLLVHYTCSIKYHMFDFNQDNTLVASPFESTSDNKTDSDIKIYTTDPLKLCQIIQIKNASVKVVRMFYRTNLIFFVAVGDEYTMSMLNVYDDAKKTLIHKINLNSNIVDFKCVDKYIVIHTADTLHIYEMADLKCVKMIPVTNKIFAANGFKHSEKQIFRIAYVDKTNAVEYVKILDLLSDTTVSFQAHNNEISYMTFNIDGSRLATASIKGTIIRVFDTQTGAKLYEFRRGSKNTKIQHISFNNDGNFMAVLSGTPSVHIYNLTKMDLNRRSVFSKVGGYFDSVWSFAWYYDDDADCERKCCFNPANQLVIISEKMGFKKIHFDLQNGGEAILK